MGCDSYQSISKIGSAPECLQHAKPLTATTTYRMPLLTDVKGGTVAQRSEPARRFGSDLACDRGAPGVKELRHGEATVRLKE